MGLTFHKSVKLGPFRYNLSGGGLGVSVGVKGLRLGSGPRGNYINVGRGGLRYRASLPASGVSNQQTSSQPYSEPSSDSQVTFESNDVSAMRDSSAESLIAEITQKRSAHRFFGLSLAFGVLLLLILALAAGATTFLVGLLILVPILVLVRRNDLARKTTVLLYEVEDEFLEVFENVRESFESVKASGNRYSIETIGQVSDYKRNSGASSEVSIGALQIDEGLPSDVASNVKPLHLQFGMENWYLFPDKLLIFTPQGIGSVSYENLQVEFHDVRFIEQGWVPSEAEVVDKTWKYVNKNGGPDRRFKDNRELPICLYERVMLTSPNGLNRCIQVSARGTGKRIQDAIERLRSFRGNDAGEAP